MWLQKIFSDVQKLVLKKEEQLKHRSRRSNVRHQPLAKERIQHFQARLLDLDRRLAELS
jgi:hypothetical protein